MDPFLKLKEIGLLMFGCGLEARNHEQASAESDAITIMTYKQ